MIRDSGLIFKMKEFHYVIIFIILLCCSCRAYHQTENEMYRRFNSINDIFRHFNSENEILQRFNSGNEIFRRFSAENENSVEIKPIPFAPEREKPRSTFSENSRRSNSQIDHFREYLSSLRKPLGIINNKGEISRAENSENAISNRVNLGNEIIQKLNSKQEFPQSERERLAKKYLDLFVTPQNKSSAPAPNFVQLLDKFRAKLREIDRVCSKTDFYNSYNPNHRRAVHTAASFYNEFEDFESLMEMSELLKLREELHPQVWYVSLRTAQLERMPQTLAMERPHPLYLFPTRFFPDSIMNHKQSEDEECVVLDEHIGEDNGVENKLWYFREDVQMNAHHWIWHLLYPLNSSTPIDRRGESFYYFHHEIMARYITERIANGMDLPAPFNMQLDSVVSEPYNPHLQDGVSTRNWAPRLPNQSLSASLNETLFEQLYNLTIKRDRIVDSLLAGFVFSGNRLVPIGGKESKVDYTNEIGELTEASRQSINPDFYGSSGYHNQGHLILANLIGSSSPGTLGVMADETTAMRDVIFYRWHRLLDMLFQAYKELHLSPYPLYQGEYALVFPGVDVTHIQLLPENGGTVNSVHTFWNTRRIHLEGGLDFNGRNESQNPRDVHVCAKHLDHEEFNYHIKIVNSRKVAIKATIRIYLAPRYKTAKEEDRYTIEEQRTLFFALDSFVTILKPGSNVIIRRSVDSALTAPWPKSVRELRENIKVNGSLIDASPALNCECGFPHHLLLPRGTENGMTFDLFVMATDTVADEKVNPSPRLKSGRKVNKKLEDIATCTPSYLHCGIPGKSYPDSKPMGYPFDRKPYTVLTHSHSQSHPAGRVGRREVSDLDEFISHVPNMATTQIVIVHENVQLELEK